MFNRRNFLQTAGAVAAVSTFNIRKASAADDLNWSIHCDLTGPAAEGGKPQGDGFTAYAKWINASGGIRGRKVNLTINDFDLQGRRGGGERQKGVGSGPRRLSVR